MITWQQALKRDLTNVKQGRVENGEDTTGVDMCLTIINDEMSIDEVAQFLNQQNLNWFANEVRFGNYTAIAKAENEPAEESEEA